jgi:segregation and condensation protein A
MSSPGPPTHPESSPPVNPPESSRPADPPESSPPPARLADLELDLDVFAGPFDLLLSLVLREELDLLEVELAEIVVAYVDHLSAAGELDLEAATEFLVLIAALLELKSRLMLPGEDLLGEFDELAPAEAAEELLERMLHYARFRGAGAWMAAAHAAGQAYLDRVAPLPPALRRVSIEAAERAYDPAVLGQAIGGLLRTPPPIDVRHIHAPRVSVAERLEHLRRLLARGRFSFDDAVDGADRVTVAVTLFALLELYKRGEAGWEQDVPFGPITVRAPNPATPATNEPRPAATNESRTAATSGSRDAEARA